MSTTHGLEQLKELSKSAVGHSDLVALARTQELAPSQVQKLARSAGYGARQAEAARYLAVIRRDHGIEALNAFIETMERVRNAAQVQDNKGAEMTATAEVDRIVRNLQRVADPYARLQLVVKHGLKQQTAEVINELTADHCYFWTDYDGEILFDTLAKKPRPGIVRMDDKEQVATVVSHRNRILLVVTESSDDERARLVIDFGGMQQFLGITDAECAKYVRMVLEKLTAQTPIGRMWRLHQGTELARRKYLADSDPLAIQTELWLLRSRFRGGRLFELRKTALPIPIKESAPEEENELDPIVDRFLELGWTKEQVREEFLAVIKDVAENCRPQFMLALIGAKCFNWRDPEVAAILRTKYFGEMWRSLIQYDGGFHIDMFARIHSSKLYPWDDEQRKKDRQFYQTEFTRLLSQGKLARVWQLVFILGPKLLFYAELEDAKRKEAKDYIKGLAPAAFRMAYEASNYGVAAALVQKFGTKECFDPESVEQVANEAVMDELKKLGFNPTQPHHATNLFREPYTRRNNGKNEQSREAKFNKLRERRNKLRDELLTARQEQIRNVAQLAIDLDQPIRFVDEFVYYGNPLAK